MTGVLARQSPGAEGVSRFGRIAILLPTLDAGGAERATVALAEALAASGAGVDAVYLPARGWPRLDPPEGVRHVALGPNRVSAALPSLVAYLRRERPVALLSSMTHANVTAIAAGRIAGRATKVVVNQHTTLSQVVRTSILRRDRAVVAAARRLYPWADTVTAVSQGVADDLLSEAELDAVVVIPNIIDVEELRRRAVEPPDHAWPTTPGPPVVTAVGRLVPAKDFGCLLHGFALLRRRREVRFLVVGDGPERARLRALAEELGISSDVDFPGFVRNPLPLIARAAVHVLSSTREGLPTVLLEALAVGTPVVATDCQSGPREVLEDGRLGRLVPPRDPAALAAAIDDALDGQSPPVTEANLSRYSREAVVPRYLEILEAA